MCDDAHSFSAARSIAINSKTLITTIAEAAADKKAENIVILDLRGLASYTDYLVLATGTSSRQVAAIGEGIEQKVAAANGPKIAGREGYEQGLWVLVDFSEVIVHVFDPTQREIFDLERLWADAPRIHWNDKNPPQALFEEKTAPAARVRRAKA